VPGLRRGRQGWPKIVSGDFDDIERLADWVELYDGKSKAVYLTLNPVKPDLLARAENRARVGVKGDDTTKDQHVLRRVWLPIDFDPVRVSGVSSSDSEHALAVERALADSGNGGHLIYAIDLPNDEESRDLASAFLQAVAARPSNDRVSVDVSVYNAARI
jgi:hypothetical protein